MLTKIQAWACYRKDETGSAVTRRLCRCSWWPFWTLFKYWAGSWHSSLKRLNCWRKAVQSLIRYSWIFNAQLHVHFKKWTLKFKTTVSTEPYQLLQWNLHNMLCGYSHIKPKLWLKSVLPLLKYRRFYRGLFFNGAPCTCRWWRLCV